MRQNHAAGEKRFVDYAGDTVTVVVDRLTSLVWRCRTVARGIDGQTIRIVLTAEMVIARFA